MIEEFVSIETNDGTMNTFIVGPERDGPWPVVVFLMDAPGMREEIRNMSRRIASAGYVVAAPHLYYRQVEHYNLFETGDRDRMFELMSSLSNDMVVDDARAVLAALAGKDASQFAADTSTVGTVGYCMSGPFALYLAAKDERIRCAASIHGVALVTEADDSPHLQLPDVAGEVYVGCAETDDYAPPKMIAAFEAALEDSGTAGEVEWYSGTEHGFAFAERPQYIQAASERHWERLHSLFSRKLGTK
ncbi:MAG: dienelactone hydrolase family protein [Actinobacteria bacterium]|nr:dienelactone hydrolase family protein [Actinomycetota bacterium]